MKEGMPDPLSKATKLKQKIEEENQQIKEQEEIAQTKKVKEIFDEQAISKESFDTERTDLLESDQKLNIALETAGNDRKEIKRTGKKALSEITSVKDGMEHIRTNPETRKEIFGDTIHALKQINELKKSGPKQRQAIRESLNTLNQTHLEDADMLLKSIKEDHPDYITAKEKVDRYTHAQQQVIDYSDQVEKFFAKYPERLEDQISYDSHNHESIDITINQELKKLDEDIKVAQIAYEKADKEKTNFKTTKKGFFESQRSYDLKGDIVSQASIDAHATYNELWATKRVLDDTKYEFKNNRALTRLFGTPMNHIHANNNEINDMVKDTPTIQVLAERMKTLMQAKLEQLKPTEKEQTLASLVNLVESKKHVIETRPYHK